MGDDSDESMEPLLCQGEDQDDQILILGELVGAYQLSTEELVTSKVKEKHLRPYAIVKFGGKTIHFTSPAAETGRDPIWTVSTGSLFLLQVSPAALLHQKLKVSIWSKKNVSSLRGAVLLDMDTYFLGKISIDGPQLLRQCHEERIELPLQDLHGNQEFAESSIALRFRLATESDVRLVGLLREQGISPPALSNDNSFHRSESRFAKENNPVKDLLLKEGSKLPIAVTPTETDESQVAGEFIVDALSFAFKASTKSDQSGVRKVRIKPGPDPNRAEETKFMTPLQISQETRKPSQVWVDAGSGSVGTLHLEVLSCHGLPNVDVGEAVGNLTDCFVCCVFEDVMVQTPVIDDELSPHWLPWTQRAFRIGIVHPSSTLYLGVFDYDLGSPHDPLGRVAIGLTNFQSNTTYTLKYKLYPTSDLSERESIGIITVRIRIEYPDEKAAVIAARQPKPVFHVNTRKQKTFKVLRYSCFGEYDIEEKFTWAVTRSYIGEILEYWRAIKFYIGESFWSLIFWRGQVEVCSISLPLHSAMLFVSGTVLIERPELIVPFYCLFAAWFLLATMSHRRHTPSPWDTCTSFLQYMEILVTGKASRGVKKSIRPTEYLKQTQEYNAAMTEWKESYQNSVDSKAAMEEKLLSIGDENIGTTVSEQMIPLALLERLGRYQGIVGRLLTRFRRVKSIIIWEDSMTSFWITATCLALGLVGLLLPWRFILYLVGRIVVWGFLGPHMKFVDIWLRQSNADKALRELEDFRKQSRMARIRREEAVKLKDMKCLAFGEFVTVVPSDNLPRHYDRPLHESLARYVPPTDSTARTPASSRIPGQQLYGTMIPHTKGGFERHQEEVEANKARCAEIEQQLARLQTIEERLSTRSIATGDVDQDLPDQLGYEVTLFEGSTGGSVAGDMEKEGEVTVSLSPTGFRDRLGLDSEKCAITYQRSRTLSPLSVAKETINESLDQEETLEEDVVESKSLESVLSLRATEADQGACGAMATRARINLEKMTSDLSYVTPRENNFAAGHELSPREHIGDGDSIASFVTPLPEMDTRPQNDPPFMTPEQDSREEEDEEEEKKDEDVERSSAIDIPDLTGNDNHNAAGISNTNSPRRRLKGPNGKAAHSEDTKKKPEMKMLGSMVIKLDGDSPDYPKHYPASSSISNATSLMTGSIDSPRAAKQSHTFCGSITTAPSLMSGSTENSSDETLKVKHTTSDSIMRRTWSSASLQADRQWIKENPSDTVFEMQTSSARRSSVIGEEGLEVVAMGRLRTIGDEDLASDDDDLVDPNDNFADETLGEDDCADCHGLSIPYKSNSYVQVAHFRPLA